jgi:hypothetical protein
MTKENHAQKSGLNECSSCKSWKVDSAHSKSRLLNTSASGGKMGLCVGGGFDGSHTQADETCSMWKPLIDKHRVMPIFYPKDEDGQ